MVNKKRIGTTILIVSILLFTATVGAAPMNEISNERALWNKADQIADSSESQIPGVRQITYNETDGKGNILYTTQSLLLIEERSNDPYLTIREYGDTTALELMDRYTDGLVLTPFNDNIYDVEYSYTNVDEIIQNRTTAVYTFKMAYDASLPFYNPNYQEDGTILGWDVDEDDFDGTITGTLWLDKITGAPVKMESVYELEDNTQLGTLKLTQTVYYSQSNALITPTQIHTEGTLRVVNGKQGKIFLTDFQIIEEQDGFWENQKIVKGETVKY